MRIVLLVVALLALPSVAKEREGVVASPTIEVGGEPLHLLGLGLRKKFVFKIPVDDAPQMLRDLERGKIGEAMLRNNK